MKSADASDSGFKKGYKRLKTKNNNNNNQPKNMEKF